MTGYSQQLHDYILPILEPSVMAQLYYYPIYFILSLKSIFEDSKIGKRQSIEEENNAVAWENLPYFQAQFQSNLNWDLHYNHCETHPPGQVYLSHF